MQAKFSVDEQGKVCYTAKTARHSAVALQLSTIKGGDVIVLTPKEFQTLINLYQQAYAQTGSLTFRQRGVAIDGNSYVEDRTKEKTK